MALFLWQLLLLCFSRITNGGDIDCTTYQKCMGQTKNCVDFTDGQKCVVTCGSTSGQDQGCLNAIINCEAGVACEVC